MKDQIKIELHSHTYHSHQSKVFYDGTCPPQDMVKTASQLGLGAIAITDHDSLRGAQEARKFAKKHNIIVIPGEEVTTADGHCLALGIQEVVRPGMPIEETLDNIHQQGGIAISSHPFDIKHDGLREKSRLCDALEAFNALNLDRLANIKAARFAAENKIPGTAGSDAHHTTMIGHGNIIANAHDQDSILKAIKKNKFQLATKYPSVKTVMNYAVLRLKMSYDFTSDYIENNYSFPKRQIAKNLLGMVNRSPGKIDYIFKGMAYMSFAGILTYSAAKHAIGK